ncbi:MAG TPA: hypothetical protein VK705_05655 [Ferruginibacter sp.]|jgi:hypothetical protein|nr:hypothetical protein [Ferruginibacter sp.]
MDKPKRKLTTKEKIMITSGIHRERQLNRMLEKHLLIQKIEADNKKEVKDT